jgi:anti-anti-sigma regulatory factor
MLVPHAGQAALMDLPYSVTPGDDHVAVLLHRDAMDAPSLAADAGASFLSVSSGEVRIDFSCLSHVNSVLLAWIIRVVNLAKPRAVVLMQVSERHAVLLRRMRLDQLLEIR